MLYGRLAPLTVTQNLIQLDHDDSWYLNRAICSAQRCDEPTTTRPLSKSARLLFV